MKKVYSFGFKYKHTFHGASVYDVRRFKNPHSVHSLQKLNGRHPNVLAYVLSDPRAVQFIEWAIQNDTDVLAVGCYGGKHRSVAIAEEIGKRTGAEVVHLDIDRR